MIARVWQRGHTLVELMIALALSLYLVTGLIQSLLANKQAFRFVVHQAQINNSGLYALQVFEEHLQRAGYRNENFVSTSHLNGADAFNENDLFTTSAVVAGANNVSGDSTIKPGTDVLHMRYFSALDGEFKDCRGANLEAQHGLVTMSFFVDPENQLRCRGRQNAGGGRPSAVLLQGVAQMQVLYRLRQVDGASIVYMYLNADEMNQRADQSWRSVDAIKLVVVTTHEHGVTEQAATEVVQVLDEFINLPGERRSWKIFEATYFLENALWIAE